MDNNYVVYKLTRNINDRQLQISNELTMKDIQRFDYTPGDFDCFLLDEKYSVFKSKIFYFFNRGKNIFPDGILEAEDLIEEERTKVKKEYNRGPYQFKGTFRFYNVFR